MKYKHDDFDVKTTWCATAEGQACEARALEKKTGRLLGKVTVGLPYEVGASFDAAYGNAKGEIEKSAAAMCENLVLLEK